MFKPKKPDPGAQTSNRMRLPQLESLPGIKVVQEQFDMARQKRGLIVELPWTGSSANHKYMLMVQWEGPAEFPLWTLYEEGAGISKMHWSQTFPPTDVQLMYDVLSMSVESMSASKIPDELKPKTGFGDIELKQKEGYVSGQPSNPTVNQPALATPPPVPAPAPTPPPAPPTPPPVNPYAQPGYPPQGYPQQPYPGQQQGYPPPGYPPPGYPPYPQQMAPPGYPQAPPQQQPGYGQQAPWQQSNQGGGWPANQGGGNPYPAAAPAPTQQYPSSSSSSASELKPIDYNSMMQKRSNVLLGTLLVEAGLVTDPTLNAALKIQELVREEKMDHEQAFDALKRLHSMGSSIDEYLSPSDYKTGKGPSKPRPTGGGGGAAPGKSPAEAEQRARDLHAAIDLLVKAGILNENDLKTANAVRAKHGGDISQILKSAGKLDATTFDATMVCINLIHSGKMKVEQCIIALNYCSRSRVSFDAAMEELGWPNPRKK